MWLFGVFPGKAVVPYMLAQLGGSVLGAEAGRLVWGPVVAQLPTRYAAVQPAPGWTDVTLFLVEMTSMAAIILIIGLSMSSPRMARYLPWLVGILVGGAIALLGTQTGGSDNPARQFGPAVLSGSTDYLWIYLVAPLAGAGLAAWARATVRRHRRLLRHCPRRASTTRYPL